MIAELLAATPPPPEGIPELLAAFAALRAARQAILDRASGVTDRELLAALAERDAAWIAALAAAKATVQRHRRNATLVRRGYRPR